MGIADRHKVVIAGAGVMGRAAGLLLRDMADFKADLWIGDELTERAAEAAAWIKGGSRRPTDVEPFSLPQRGSSPELERILRQGDLLLDCLPGSEAVRMAWLARRYQLHYANLTEYAKASFTIQNEIAAGADRSFLLQSGLAPGVINVLAHHLFQRFCSRYDVEKVDQVVMRTGALTRYAQPPHFHALTWDPVGVSTEYVADAEVLRGGVVTLRSALSERASVLINGVVYEEALTSGGAADLPRALAGRVQHLDYKSLRYPGHFAWIESILAATPDGADPRIHLHTELLRTVPLIDQDDFVVLYAAVQGQDAAGNLRRLERSLSVEPFHCGSRTLTAVQACTAAGLAEAARLLLGGCRAGAVLQSHIEPERFLTGPFVGPVYDFGTIVAL